MEVKYAKQAFKELQKMPKGYRDLVEKGINGLLKTPPEGDIISLQGFGDDRKRLRIGRYRIIFRFVDDSVWVIDIGVRGDVYK